ncbi:MAG: hypothetical protein OHK0046_28430 [Anaerolineae bacterium]
MPYYEYRCKNCDNRFALFYKTYSDYDEAEPACPRCASNQLARLIGSVAIPKPTRDFGKMSSGEMLSVLESGDSRQVGEMFQQIGGTDPAVGKQYHDATERLLKGESMSKVEKDLQASEKPASTSRSAD